jgi:hypothetical protein
MKLFLFFLIGLSSFVGIILLETLVDGFFRKELLIPGYDVVLICVCVGAFLIDGMAIYALRA